MFLFHLLSQSSGHCLSYVAACHVVSKEKGKVGETPMLQSSGTGSDASLPPIFPLARSSQVAPIQLQRMLDKAQGEPMLWWGCGMASAIIAAKGLQTRVGRTENSACLWDQTDMGVNFRQHFISWRWRRTHGVVRRIKWWNCHGAPSSVAGWEQALDKCYFP